MKTDNTYIEEGHHPDQKKDSTQIEDGKHLDQRRKNTQIEDGKSPDQRRTNPDQRRKSPISKKDITQIKEGHHLHRRGTTPIRTKNNYKDEEQLQGSKNNYIKETQHQHHRSPTTTTRNTVTPTKHYKPGHFTLPRRNAKNSWSNT